MDHGEAVVHEHRVKHFINNIKDLQIRLSQEILLLAKQKMILHMKPIQNTDSFVNETSPRGFMSNLTNAGR